MARTKNSKKNTRDKKKKTTVRVNMSGVEGGRRVVPEGDYRAKVAEVSQEESDNGEYLKWKFSTVDKNKKHNNVPLYYNTSLQPQALWNLRNVLEALGVDVPDDNLDLDLSDLVDKECIVATTNEIYEGKRKSVIVDIYDDEAEIDDGDEEGEENEDLPDEDEVMKMKAKQLEEVVEEHELDVDLDDYNSLAKKRKAVVKAIEEKDDSDEDNGDEDGISADDVEDMDSDELADLVKKHKLDVSFKGLKSVKKKRKLVLAALEEEGLLEEEDDD